MQECFRQVRHKARAVDLYRPWALRVGLYRTQSTGGAGNRSSITFRFVCSHCDDTDANTAHEGALCDGDMVHEDALDVGATSETPYAWWRYNAAVDALAKQWSRYMPGEAHGGGRGNTIGDSIRSRTLVYDAPG